MKCEEDLDCDSKPSWESFCLATKFGSCTQVQQRGCPDGIYGIFDAQTEGPGTALQTVCKEGRPVPDTECDRDYTKLCPEGWKEQTNAVDTTTLCIPEEGAYGGSCSIEQNFDGWNASQKASWSTLCSAVWPCNVTLPKIPMPDTMPVVGQPGSGRCMARHGLLLAAEQCAQKTSERTCVTEATCQWIGTCWVSQTECRFFETEDKLSGSFEVPYLHATGRCYAGPTNPDDQAKCEKAVRGGGAFDRAVVALGSTDGLVISAADGEIGISQQASKQALWKLFAVPGRTEWYYLQSQSGCAQNNAPCGQWLAVSSPSTDDLALVGADNLDRRAKFEIKAVSGGSPAELELVARGTGSNDCSELRRRLMSLPDSPQNFVGSANSEQAQARRLLGSNPPPPESPSEAQLKEAERVAKEKEEEQKRKNKEEEAKEVSEKE
jgi:CPW-WPC domain-containing protein